MAPPIQMKQNVLILNLSVTRQYITCLGHSLETGKEVTVPHLIIGQLYEELYNIFMFRKRIRGSCPIPPLQHAFQEVGKQQWSVLQGCSVSPSQVN